MSNIMAVAPKQVSSIRGILTAAMLAALLGGGRRDCATAGGGPITFCACAAAISFMTLTDGQIRGTLAALSEEALLCKAASKDVLSMLVPGALSTLIAPSGCSGSGHSVGAVDLSSYRLKLSTVMEEYRLPAPVPTIMVRGSVVSTPAHWMVKGLGAPNVSNVSTTWNVLVICLLYSLMFSNVTTRALWSCWYDTLPPGESWGLISVNNAEMRGME
mmetsp:Transcript_26847/g.58508  ORF Transcript_26847/g.58508 Transcript_26847/m.58508 type:complete len:216 (-) Transcript_26847:3716-4363(-)